MLCCSDAHYVFVLCLALLKCSVSFSVCVCVRVYVRVCLLLQGLGSAREGDFFFSSFKDYFGPLSLLDSGQ